MRALLLSVALAVPARAQFAVEARAPAGHRTGGPAAVVAVGALGLAPLSLGLSPVSGGGPGAVSDSHSIAAPSLSAGAVGLSLPQTIGGGRLSVPSAVPSAAPAPRALAARRETLPPQNDVPPLGPSYPVAFVSDAKTPGVPKDSPVGLRPPSRLREALWFYRGSLETAMWYTGPRLIERWNEINRMAWEQSIEKDQKPAVERMRSFFVEQRLLGTSGAFQPTGFRIAPPETSLSDARRLYARYFPRDETADAAFSGFIERFEKYKDIYRLTYFRKTIMYILRDAAARPAARLAEFFSGLSAEKDERDHAEFQRERQRDVVAAYERVVRQAVLDFNRELAPGKRVVGVALYGSFALGSAGPDSDMDTQVIIENNDKRTKDRFASFLKERWHEAGGTHPISVFSFAVPPSRGILERLNGEPYRIVSPYEGVAGELERRAGVSPPSPRPRGPASAAFSWAYGTLIWGITFGYDVYWRAIAKIGGAAAGVSLLFFY